MPAPLRVRPVHRYRRPRYPGARGMVRPDGFRRRRGLAAAAVLPIAAGGLATLEGCLWDNVSGGLQYPYVTRYLTEAEARAVIAGELRSASARPADPCDTPLLGDRILEDQLFEHAAVATFGPVHARLDVLAPAADVPAEGTCPAVHLVAVGVEFTTVAAGDDESVSGNPDGLTADEKQAVAQLRLDLGDAILVVSDQDFPYEVDESAADAATDPTARAPAENALRTRVREFVDELRRDGLI